MERLKKQKSDPECWNRECLLCQSIMPEWLEVVQLSRKVHAFKKGETIFREGEAVKGIYFILDGKVKIGMTMGKKVYILRLARNGDILGHRGYGMNEVYPINAIALEATTACFVTTELFLKLLKTNPDFLYKLAFFYADELKRTEFKMKNLAHMPVKGRVAEALLQIRDVFGKNESGMLSYRVSRKDMAAMAGTTYETVIRMLNELVKDGLISLAERNVLLIDEPALENLSNHHQAR